MYAPSRCLNEKSLFQYIDISRCMSSTLTRVQAQVSMRMLKNGIVARQGFVCSISYTVLLLSQCKACSGLFAEAGRAGYSSFLPAVPACQVTHASPASASTTRIPRIPASALTNQVSCLSHTTRTNEHPGRSPLLQSLVVPRLPARPGHRSHPGSSAAIPLPHSSVQTRGIRETIAVPCAIFRLILSSELSVISTAARPKCHNLQHGSRNLQETPTSSALVRRNAHVAPRRRQAAHRPVS